MKYEKVVVQDTKRNHRVQLIVTAIVFATVGVSCFLTYNMVMKSIFMAKAEAFVENEMVFPNTQVLNHKEFIENGKRYIDVTLIGAALPKDSLQLAMMTKLDSVGLGGTIINIKQGFSISNNEVIDNSNFDKFYSVLQQELLQRQNTIDSLKDVVRHNNAYDDEARRIAPEIRVLFPTISDIALSRMVAASTGEEAADTVNMVFVNAPKGLSETEREKLKQYVGVRLKQHDVHLTMNPVNFPWPSVMQSVQVR